MLDNIPITGVVHAILYDENRNIKEEIFSNNMVVTSGLSYIAKRMWDDSVSPNVIPSEMSHMGIGTGNDPVALGDTDLASSTHRQAFTSPITIGASPYKSVVFTCGFGENIPNLDTVSIKEMGIFNASVSGTMLCRTVFDTAIVKNRTDTLTVVWTVNIG